jgi:hypothetical protein
MKLRSPDAVTEIFFILRGEFHSLKMANRNEVTIT